MLRTPVPDVVEVPSHLPDVFLLQQIAVVWREGERRRVREGEGGGGRERERKRGREIERKALTVLEDLQVAWTDIKWAPH